jgi:hypothetical protein
MSVFLDVLRELAAMFFGTPRLAIPALAVIAIAALAAHYANPQIAGALLLFGLCAVLAENVLFEARRAKR